MLQNNKIKFFEGIRGVAALMVLLNHSLEAFYPPLFNQARMGVVDKIIAFSPLNIFYNGWVAVAIFFVMSGYVLSYKFFIFENNPEYVDYRKEAPRLALRRYFRFIVPIFSVSLVCYFLLKFNLVFIEQAGNITKSEWLAFYINHVKNIPQFSEILKYSFVDVFTKRYFLPNYDAALWTIFREFWGSILVYFLVYSFLTKKYRIFIFILLAILLSEGSVQIVGISVMLLGLALADHKSYQRFIDKIFAKKIIFYLVSILSLILLSTPKINFLVEGNFYQFFFFAKNNPEINYGIGATLFILLALNSKKIQEFFSSKFFVELGKISFSLYLIHIPIIISCSCFLFEKIYLAAGYGIAALTTIIATIFVSLLISKIIYRYIDLSGITLSKIIVPDRFLRK